LQIARFIHTVDYPRPEAYIAGAKTGTEPPSSRNQHRQPKGVAILQYLPAGVARYQQGDSRNLRMGRASRMSDN
jgi:hypothetical protein